MQSDFKSIVRVRENSIRFSDTELLVGGVYSKTPGWEKNHNIYFFSFVSSVNLAMNIFF